MDPKAFHFNGVAYLKNTKYLDRKSIYQNYPKMEQFGFKVVINPKNADEVAKSSDPDQTTPVEAV